MSDQLAKRIREMRSEAALEAAANEKPAERLQVDLVTGTILASAAFGSPSLAPNREAAVERRQTHRALKAGVTVTAEGPKTPRPRWSELSDDDFQRINSSKLTGPSLDAYTAELDRRIGTTGGGEDMGLEFVEEASDADEVWLSELQTDYDNEEDN
jgi:hypothetical protein